MTAGSPELRASGSVQYPRQRGDPSMRLLTFFGVLTGVLAQFRGGDDAAHFPLADGALWVYKTREGRANTKVGEPGPLKEGPKRTIQCAEGKESASLTTFDGKS